MAYERSCRDLAKAFLIDGPRCLPPDIDALAQAIQDVCEDHCRMIEDQEREAREKFNRNFADLGPHPRDGEVFTMDEFNPSLFGPLPRAPRRKLAHVIDAGPGEVHNVVLLKCACCGWESGWTTEYTLTESKRGIPCPRCNS